MMPNAFEAHGMQRAIATIKASGRVHIAHQGDLLRISGAQCAPYPALEGLRS
ncbi:MAG: hypothetical protein KDG50_13425 [Chromatiales bacterium]|nr:hypothetical protein [Chromatiales bacterium]